MGIISDKNDRHKNYNKKKFAFFRKTCINFILILFIVDEKRDEEKKSFIFFLLLFVLFVRRE
jgi:hypothetical protein